ncbi:MAG: EI24 domain-containing protein, partial [Pirellulaceae bacterium]|nr:EI24 domain-containing protein [Pirellulaceae bacterium]
LLVCGGLTILMWKLMEGVLCGYFYGILVEKVERSLGIAEDEITSISFLYNLVDTIINLTLLISVNVVFFMLNFFPIIGGLAALVLSTGFTWFILGVDFLNYPLALRGVRRLDQFRYGRRHLGHNVGIGGAIFFFEFLPIIGAILVTSTAVGAVLLHRKIENAQPSK